MPSVTRRQAVATLAVVVSGFVGGGGTLAALRSTPVAARPARLAARADAAVATVTHPASLAPTGPRTLAPSPAAAAPAPTLVVPEAPVPSRPLAPTALVTPHHPLTAAAVSRLSAAGPLTVVTTGTVALAGAPAAILGVSPAAFRNFTPGPTRDSTALWQAVSQGGAAVSFAVARSRHLTLGSVVALGARDVRIVAEADFSLPQAGVVVDLPLAGELGLSQEEILVDTPSAARVAAIATPVLGAVQVVSLVPPPAPPAAAVAARPTSWRQLYTDAAATCPGMSWTLLAAIGQIESGDGQNDGPSTAGALGPMQFLPSTWRAYGYDPVGSAPPNIFDPVDAVYSAARLLCIDGAGSGPAAVSAAVFDYNHATWYVREVLGLAQAYQREYGG